MAIDAAAGLTGGCQCGAVRYRLIVEPTGVNICHCRMCQKASGGPLMAFGGVRLDQLVWTRGAPKIFASSAIGERGFCAQCGTPLTYRMHELEGDRISVALGSLDQPAAVAPTIQFGVESKVPWLDGALALPAQKTADWLKLSEAAVGNRQHPDRET
jgi:hypothetical protein